MAAMAAARSQLWRGVIEQRIGGATPAQALALYERVKDSLTPRDRRALEGPIASTADDAATDAWLARETSRDGGPLTDRLGRDEAPSDTQRTLLRFKIAARDSMAEAKRVATVKGLDDTLAETTATIATQPSRYRIGTLAKLAEAYAAAGAPEQADATGRLALLEAVFLPFTPAPTASSASSTPSPVPSARWPRRSCATSRTPSPTLPTPPAPPSTPRSARRCRRGMRRED